MAVHAGITHRTRYQFDRGVTLGPHTVRLRPAPHCRTPIANYTLHVGPGRHFLNWQQDPFGNHVARIVVPEPVTELDITVTLTADMTVINPFDFFVEDYAESYPFTYSPVLADELSTFRRRVREDGSDQISPALAEWLHKYAGDRGEPVNSVAYLGALASSVAETVKYSTRMEHGVLTPEETLLRGVGSCRDSAWLLVAALRELGLAARFVSGYLIQLAPDRPATPDTAGFAVETGPHGEDFTDLHAWAEVYLPGAGWIGLDATSGLFAGEGHIPLSATPSPSQSAPISGTVGSCETTMTFTNEIRRIHQTPRVTKPYTEDQWQNILDVGEQIDTRLTEQDVRLTMGGEPTFVSVEDMDSPQWNVAADGEEKRALAIALADRLKAHYAPNGVVHHGQGKWYPGEPLPRWQIALTWRTDGVPLWREAKLLDNPWGEAAFDPADGDALAHRCLLSVAGKLGIDPAFVLPAYEDRLQEVVAQALEPVEDDFPLDIDPSAPRSRLTEQQFIDAIDAREHTPTGWVLPLHRTEADDAWGTVRWRTRRQHLVLVPGKSPMGLRLPLASLLRNPPPPRPERDPFFDTADLPDPAEVFGTAEVSEIGKAPTTALCVEAREGHLFVFLPPLPEIRSAIMLLRLIESTADEMHVPVVIEGYPVPASTKTQTLTVTPDPGVIEVNVQPAASWPEFLEINSTLHEAARAVGLGAEKFALDGSHHGTGGGSHITLGGPSPADSPLLRRPDLLISLLTFWQHHPSLSYLFSGKFIGPTSQAPRIDEARHDTLYEIETAFAQLRLLKDDARPWVVDRALRHLLTDLTGNTHRSEFCIDKLFSPDSPRGRLGLLELRGFEMPPHEQMAAVQALLVRALVSRFWNEPYTGDLVRWGTRLHDQFLLPAYVDADIADVVADLRMHGIAFDPGWMKPFLEFRFPTLATMPAGPVTFELRSALEPWNVLGEEATGSGTARYVDSSVERLQVALAGAVAGRHIVTCNGATVPLRTAPANAIATAESGALVGGLRFKAWAPPSALHPSIGVQSPLVFQVIDTWTQAVLASCTYHVVHPGGRAYDTFPVNANEAEARRAARFTLGGAPSTATGAREQIDGQTPSPTSQGEMLYTVDLRRTLGAW